MNPKETVPFLLPSLDEITLGIQRYAGVLHEQKSNRVLSEKISQIAKDVPTVLAPRSLLKKTTIIAFKKNTLTGECISIASRRLVSFVSSMNRPAFLYGFALTMGQQIDRLVAQCQRTSWSKALFLDAAGSFFVGHYADLVEKHLRNELSLQGFELSARFSPGYCDWNVGQGQTAISQFLMPQSIGIKISPAGAMSPLKSITGIVVAAASMPMRKPCAWCDESNCPYRH